MLLFIGMPKIDSSKPIAFQYIPCYCLSFMTHVDLITLQAFQYIPCYCLSQNRVIHAIEIFISIHPMLLFIVVVPEITNDRLIFQYIPCYCLSMLPPAFFCVNSYFNTSHVTVYHHKLSNQRKKAQISIHPMLLFIYLSHITDHACISISIHPMLLFIRCQLSWLSQFHLFQYIPCYCLSTTTAINDFKNFIFQYIPCYCLSRQYPLLLYTHLYFNTSHVTVYLTLTWSKDKPKDNFNTSHVTVYRKESNRMASKIGISIHPMLLFI